MGDEKEATKNNYNITQKTLNSIVSSKFKLPNWQIITIFVFILV